MFFKNKSQQSPTQDKLMLSHYADFLKSYPISHKDFLQSFEHFCKILQIKNASLYFFEEKTKLFVLKKWLGIKPARFSISENYELMKYLVVRQAPLIKREFAENTHDLRQPALFFFQETNSTHVYLMSAEPSSVKGLLLFDLSSKTISEQNQISDFIRLYRLQILAWLEYQTLSISHQKLSEIAHVKNQLLANVSHELQTPLNGILGISEALLDGADGELPTSAIEHIQMMRDSAQNLHKTITNFLQLAQIEAKKSEVKHEKTNVCELLAEVVSFFFDSLQKRGVELKCTDLTRPIYVFVEPDQIRTVLMNLLSNSAKFTQSGCVSIFLKKSVEMLHVTVSDTGIGIDADKRDLVFEEFYQGDGSHTRVYGGTGLGLAIAKKIINLHGGKIWASANGSQGTSFTFTIPLCPGV